ncbi:FecR domain-containing protein [Chitinophaga sp. MM2321]|uniref:FecR family protein n=1 Tax=Chitinophaga sp. MM2321 TaxID=3137178 RepID=UPI0032D56D96
MDEQRIYYLLERELEGTLEADELRELEELKVHEDSKLLEKIIAELIERESNNPMYIDAAVEDARFEKIISVDAVHGQVSRGKVYRLRRNWLRAAVAAILILGTATYFWPPKMPGKGAVAIQQHNHLPGNNKATLTLANGATITLDSAGNQVIQQGKVAVHQHNGQLQYTLQGNETVLSYNVLTVPRGAQYRLVLPDGSKVWLNAASRLRYPTAFIGKERTVELEGQGYFEIAQQADQPFKVKVNGLEVQVLGTHFDIMAYADEGTINTTLLEGAVNIVQGERLQQLKPGQQAIVDHATNHLSVQQADLDMVSAWRTDFFELNGTDLPAILRQLSRWYDVEIVYKSDTPSEVLSGRISRNLHLKDVLQALEGNDVQFRIEGNKVIVLPK